MRKISKLSDSTINKIAAGEVIERPASVVKELMENAVDAGSTRITLEVKDGGKALIRISDNGCGIEREDAALVFERHATSKIENSEDIYAVATMGFRGEALSSIAAVANVEILTNASESGPAILLERRASGEFTVRDSARAKGTTVSVSEMFANLPVRRQFLSSDSAELARITTVFTTIALSHPEISFRYVCDGKEKANYQAVQEHILRIGAVYGAPVSDSLMRGTYSDDVLEAIVYFSNLDLTRANRTGQILFVNNRVVESKNLDRGLRSGYRDLLPFGRYPIAFVFLRINPDEIDVNVHPTKREIRFADDERVARAIGRCITEGFKSNSIVNSKSYSPSESVVFENKTNTQSFISENLLPLYKEANTVTTQDVIGSEPKGPWPDIKETKQYLIPYFQLHDMYILCQIKNGLVIIDQHVAHERILFERALKTLSSGERMVTQQLLFPVMIELSLQQKNNLDTFLNAFEKTGFAIRPLSGNCIVVDGVPAALKDQPVNKMVVEMIDELGKKSYGPNEYDRNYASSFACGAAIKAGQQLSLEEINYLVDSLFQCENPYTCPHGRPIVIRIPLEEINRRFMR